MDTSSYSYFDVSVEDRIALLRFSRPEKMNSCTIDQHTELPRVLRELQADPEVSAAVVTGSGESFSIGGDYNLLEQTYRNENGELDRVIDDGRELVHAHVELDKPIIAAINGYAMGAGAAFGLLCDVIIIEHGVRIADGHIRAGIAAGDGGTLAWPLAVGVVKAKRYLLTGDWITAEEAERIGLATEVVEPGKSLERAMEYARRFVNGPQQAIRATKRAVNDWLRLGVTVTFDHSLALEGLTMRSEDAARAIEKLRDTGKGAMPPDPAAPSR